jgi:gamma-glutamyltranspeptidase/glutathione hydrolase
MFCLNYDAQSKQVGAINGSGRAPRALTVEHLRSRGIPDQKVSPGVRSDMNAVTVPGAVAGWFKTHSEFGSGKLSMAEILAPAIRLAEEGVPTHEINSSMVIEMITRDS